MDAINRFFQKQHARCGATSLPLAPSAASTVTGGSQGRTCRRGRVRPVSLSSSSLPENSALRVENGGLSAVAVPARKEPGAGGHWGESFPSVRLHAWREEKHSA